MRSIWELDIKDMVSSGLVSLSNSMSQTYARMAVFETRLESQARNTNSVFESQGNIVRKLGGLFAGVFSAYALTSFAHEAYDVGTKLETLNNVITYTSKDAADSAKNHEFLKRIIGGYRLPMMETMEGFSQFNAAMMGSVLQGEKARQVFEGVAIGATAMHLSGAATQQTFFALNQMMSKGTVQAQELKLQLANALPGAARLAAKAMGMTQAAFNDAMEKGQILAADFLPKFAKALKDEYGGAIPKAIQSTIAIQNLFNTSMIEFKAAVFEAAQPVINKFMELAIDIMPKMQHAFEEFMNIVHSFADFLSEHKNLVYGIGAAIAAAGGAYIGFNTGLLAYKGLRFAINVYDTVALGIMSLMEGNTIAATMAQLGFNAALLASPLTWAFVAVGALAGMFIYFWETSENFRASIFGLGAAFKQVFSNIMGFFKVLLAPVFDAIGLAMEGKWAQAAKAGVVAFAKLASGYQLAEAGAWVAKGGLANGVADAYNSGKKARLDKEHTTSQQNTATGYPATVPGAGGATDTASASSGKSGGSGGSGSGAKSITVTIEKLIDNLTISTTNLSSNNAEIRAAVERVLVGAVRDAEISLSRG